MKPAPFRYHEPRTVQEAISLVAQVAPEDGRILAGGQSLVPAMALRLARPSHLVDINRIPELKHLAFDDQVLSIGACVRHAAFHRPIGEGPLGQLLSWVVRHIAHYPVRARGTFCGSIANADPASEWCLVAATLGAVLVAESTRGQRTLRAPEFFQGFLTTAMQPDEILLEARLPVLPSETRFGFHEFSRRAGDYAQSMTLATLELISGVIANPRIGIGSVEAVPRRLTEVERYLTGREPSQGTFRTAAGLAAEEVSPVEDMPETMGYKRDLVRATTFRALEQAGAPRSFAAVRN